MLIAFSLFEKVIRNSWGSDWGMNGYIYVKKGVNICGVESLAVQATVTG